DLTTTDIMSLHDIIGTIEHAKDNDNIKGILLDLTSISTGRASNKLLREALADFKTADKFIVAYGKYYTQNSYYIASVADEIYLNPLGNVDFLGFSAQVPYYKELLDRLDIKMQIYYAGQYKSATEPYRRYDMSPQNRLQVREYLEDMYALYLNDISQSRDIPVEELRKIADEYLLRKAEDAVDYRLVDGIAYRDELHTNLKERMGLEESDKLKMVDVETYGNQKRKGGSFSVKDKIAVVYAEGTLVDGKGEPGNIGGDKYAKIIRKLRHKESTKAIVLRVNSPGGSVLASDVIWRELVQARKQGIPVVASFSDVAASGGYYIACMADSIFAEPNSITGSIGVFAMIPSFQKTLNNQLGVRFDTVKTGPFSNRLSLFYDISEEEGKILQESVEDFYEIFIQKVADSRKMTRDEVHAIAQGRVWTGQKALELGLVDAYGGIDEAIASAARMADLETYRINEYPRIKAPFERLLDRYTNPTTTSNALMQMQLGELYPVYQQLQDLKTMKGMQARMPFMVEY
ncbi:MAG: signal peptide peptidase SppA, partial [Bacteroidota bacterium]